MVTMKRSFLASLTLIALLLAAFPALASADQVVLGSTTSRLVAPSCPKGVSPTNCTIILTRATALETIRDGVDYPTTVTTAGRIVAFTVGLSRLSTSATTTKSDIHYLDSTYGGTTRVAVAVLKPVGSKSDRRWQVVAESPVVHVQPWLGQVVTFPLATSLPVSRGETVALTTPTWAPVLSIDLSDKDFAYRQSRTGSCTLPPSTDAAQSVGNSAQYLCDYTGTRVEYSATEVVSKAPTNAITASLCASGSVSKCPAVLAHTTALETIGAGTDYPTTIKSSGSLVSFTLGLSSLAGARTARTNDVTALNTAFGSPPEASVSVLKQVGSAGQRRWEVAAESPAISLSSYIGDTVELALGQSLPVTAGETVAITTPTWAPILFASSAAQNAYRQSRASRCTSPPSPSAAQTKVGQSTRYACDYPGVGVVYSANVVPAPVVPKNYVH